jgi:hypothetical protein
MIVARAVFHAKFGKAADVVAQMKQAIAGLSDEQMAQLKPRILTDLSGRFDTVIMETMHESLAAFEQAREAMLASAAEASPLFELVETGHNEYWTVEN